LTNISPNLTITGDSDVRVYGTSSSNQIVLASGTKAELLNFPGQNAVQIQSSADVFTVSRSGAVVTFEGSDGTVLKIPATGTGQTISFNGELSAEIQIV
jgi:RNase P/RNase MRP subunit p29